MSSNKEMLLMVDSISREKELPKELVFNAVEEALAFAAKKKTGLADALFEVEIDRSNGEVFIFRKWAVREDNIIDIPDAEVARIDLEKGEGEDGFVYEEQENDLGRSSVQMAKQAILQKIKDVEQSEALRNLTESGESKEILTATVKSFQQKSGNIVLEVGRLELMLPRSEIIPGDTFKIGDRVSVVIKKSDVSGSRVTVTASRACKEFMLALLEREVPEIVEGDIEIVSLARAPGMRCKMIVKSKRKDFESGSGGYVRGAGKKIGFDPVRAIVGMRGIRAKSIAEETNGEHLDILMYRENPAELLMDALQPAEVLKIAIDEENKTMDACIDNEHLGMAIGSRGLNVRLISDLLGWNVSVMNEEEWDKKEQARTERTVDIFMKTLDVDQDVAEFLVSNGFMSIEEIAYVPLSEWAEIEELDKETIDELRSRARDASQKKQVVFLGSIDKAREEFVKIEGISGSEIEMLAKAGVASLEDLADLATDELLEMTDLSDRRAADLIMRARKLAWEDQ